MKDTARRSGSLLLEVQMGTINMTYTNPIFLTVENIREITRYNHYIPFMRQLHHGFISERFPGWSWNEFLPKLQGKKIVKVHVDCPACVRLAMGLCMDPKVEGVWVKRNRSGVRIEVMWRMDDAQQIPSDCR